MIPISSSVIRAIDYNSDSKKLLIMFASGRTYTYYDIPSYIVEGLLNAPSAGRYFNDYIKDRF